MELKKVIKTILIGGAVALLGFSTFKACKNNDFSAVKTLTKETRLNTRAERINAPKRANNITWDDINSWQDLTQYQYKVINTQVGGASITFFPSNSNLPSLAINNVDIYKSSSGNLFLYYNYNNNIAYRVRGAYYPGGEQTDIQLVVGDILSFKNNDSVSFSALKQILIASTEIIQETEPPTATLELDLTNLTNFTLDKIYLDNNILPTNNNVIDLTTLTDGQHTLTFYDLENDNCFNSNIELIYQGFGGGLNEPLTSATIYNNSDYRGILIFNWDSSLLTEDETYKISFNGKASYNFNYLTNKSFVLNSTLNFEYDFFVEAEEYIVYGTYSFNGNDYLALREYKSSSRGLFEYKNNTLFLNCEPEESGGSTGTFIYQNNQYITPYGIYPRIISFNSEFNNNNITNFWVSTGGDYRSDNMFTFNFIDLLLNNSVELTVEQLDTYKSGYNAGYQDGLKYATSLSNLLYNFFDGIDRSLSIYVLPGIQIKYIVMIPLVFAIVKFVMSWLR